MIVMFLHDEPKKASNLHAKSCFEVGVNVGEIIPRFRGLFLCGFDYSRYEKIFLGIDWYSRYFCFRFSSVICVMK